MNESSKLKEFVNDDSDDDDAVNDDDAEDSNYAEGEIAMPCVVDGRTYPGFTKKTAVGDSSCSTPKYLYNIEELHGKTAQGLGAVQLSVKGDMHNNITLTRNNTVIEFDRRLKTKIFLNKSYT